MCVAGKGCEELIRVNPFTSLRTPITSTLARERTTLKKAVSKWAALLDKDNQKPTSAEAHSDGGVDGMETACAEKTGELAPDELHAQVCC